jgi:hypothetical protein
MYEFICPVIDLHPLIKEANSLIPLLCKALSPVKARSGSSLNQTKIKVAFHGLGAYNKSKHASLLFYPFENERESPGCFLIQEPPENSHKSETCVHFQLKAWLG